MTFVPVLAGSLMSHGGNDKHDPSLQTYVAAPLSHGSNPNSNAARRRREDDENLVANTVRSHTRPGSNTDATVVQEASVRRLTPVECERLQALPDGWTQLGGTADSKRYAALGDAVTASVAEWIGRRLVTALALPLVEAA